MAVRLILTAFFFLLIFPAKVHAALTLEAVSPTEITDPSQEITLFVSAENLSSSTQYLQVAITKEGQSNYLGFIQNNSGNWVKYASSPDLNSLVSFIPTDGNWNGEVKAKIDTSDSGFVGSGVYNIKLIKYISSSGSSSNFLPLTVNVSQQTQIPTEVITQESQKEQKKIEAINFSLPSGLKVGQEFEIQFTLSNFEPGPYFVKARIGVDSSHLSQGQTWNGDWLGDTDSWAKFPKVDSSSGKIKVRLSPTSTSGEHKIKLSLKKDDNTPIVSEEKSIIFSPNPTSTPVALTTQSKTPTPGIKSSSGTVLATSSSVASVQAAMSEHFKNKNLLSTVSGTTVTASPKKVLNLLIPNQVNEEFQIGGLSAVGGFILLCAGAGMFLKKKLSQDS